MLAAQITGFLNGVFICYTTFDSLPIQSNKWYWLSIEIFVSFVQEVSTVMLFWNLAFMYTISAKQLELITQQISEKSQLNPELIQKQNLTLSMRGYRRFNFIFQMLIIFFTLAKNIYDTLYFRIDEKFNSKLLWFISDLSLLIIIIVIITMLVVSLNKIQQQTQGCVWKNPFIIHLTLATTITVSIVEAAGYGIILFESMKFDQQHKKDKKAYNDIWYSVFLGEEPIITGCFWVILYTLFVFQYRSVSKSRQSLDRIKSTEINNETIIQDSNFLITETKLKVEEGQPE